MFWFSFLGIFGLFFLVGGVILGFYAGRQLRLASLFRQPLSRVAKLKPGLRKTRGKIAAIGKSLQSPLARKECVYYRLRVYEERKSYMPKYKFVDGFFTNYSWYGWLGSFFGGTLEDSFNDERASYSRHLLVDKEDDVRFMVEDDTGCVEVDLRGATIFTKEKARSASGGENPPPSQVEELLREEHDFDTVDRRGFFKALQFMEELLPVGSKVTVVGTLGELNSGDLRFQVKDGPLVVSDRDVAKEGQSARNQALGLAIGAASSLGVGLSCLVGALLLLVQARRARK